MKKLTLFYLLTFVISQMTFSQTYCWKDISANIPTEADLSDVYFTSDDEGWITSSSHAEIYHTADGGLTFEVQTTITKLEAIYMIDENEGYTGGMSGIVYRTVDGGDNWEILGSMASTLIDIDFATATQGYACGFGGAVFSITPEDVTNLNSGLSTNLGGITSPSENKVWVCGGGTISHFDGTTFTFQSGPAGSYNDIFFLNDQEGWIVGNNGVIGHTENGGEDWPSQINPDPEGNSLYGLFFLNENEGCAIGAQGTILKTTNGGDNWMLDEEGSTLAGTKFLRGIHFTSPTNGYVVGNGKTLLKYTEITSEENNDATLSSIQINSEELAGFNTATLNYQLELPTGTSTVPTVAATPTDTNATVVITQATELPGTATIVVTAEDGETRQTYTVEFTNVTGVFETNRKNEFTIFPNPATSELKVQSSKLKVESATVAVFTITGKKCLSKYVPAGSSEIEIEISSLNSGMYFCKIQFEDGCVTKKIVVKK